MGVSQQESSETLFDLEYIICHREKTEIFGKSLSHRLLFEFGATSEAEQYL